LAAAKTKKDGMVDVRKSRFAAAKQAAADAPMYAGGGAEKREAAQTRPRPAQVASTLWKIRNWAESLGANKGIKAFQTVYEDFMGEAEAEGLSMSLWDKALLEAAIGALPADAEKTFVHLCAKTKNSGPGVVLKQAFVTALMNPDSSPAEERADSTSAQSNRSTCTLAGPTPRNGWAKHQYGLDTYAGEWCENARHGQGTMRYANGQQYKGEWECDMKHGQGVFIYVDGSRYEGTFQDNLMDGEGTFCDFRGWSFTGDLVQNRPTKGVLTEDTGRRFQVTVMSLCLCLSVSLSLSLCVGVGVYV
jgi:hypothetical protein